MSAHELSAGQLLFLGGVISVAFSVLWYACQVISRKQDWLRLKFEAIVIYLIAYIGSFYLLARQRVPAPEALIFSVLIGIAAALVLLSRRIRKRRSGRRIPKSLRQQVIARDLIAKGLKWDSEKYHIDHIVPYSRGGDTSLKNLRVIEKQRNLRKGSSRPRMRDFFQR